MKPVKMLSGLLLVLVVTNIEAKPVAIEPESLTGIDEHSIIVNSALVPDQCKDSFSRLKHVRAQRDVASDFPSLRYIAKSAELDFLDCVNGQAEKEHDVTKEMSVEPDIVTWTEPD